MEHEQQYVEYVTARLPWLRRVAYLLCGNWNQADDLVQVAITKLFVHWRKARMAENLDGYTRTILVRVFLAERRSGWVKRVRVTAEPPELGYRGPDRAEMMAVRDALDLLPSRQRAAVVLRYFCDLSVEQAASAMRCSTGNVKSQTSRGLNTLRRLLTDPATQWS